MSTWRVTATGTEGGHYVYEITGPSNASGNELFYAACAEHGHNIARGVTAEYLDIRTHTYEIEWISS